MDYLATLEEFRERSKILGEMVTLQNEKIASKGLNFFEVLFEEGIQIAQERNVPLYCGEYGVIDQAELEGTLRWMQDVHTMFEKYGIGRALWTYKEMDFGIIGAHYAPIYEDLLQLL